MRVAMQDGDVRMSVIAPYGEESVGTKMVECEVLFNGVLGPTPKSVHMPVRSSMDQDVLADADVKDLDVLVSKADGVLLSFTES